MKEQGHEQNIVMHQDNTSAIKLENNGKASSSKRTQHIDIRHFHIKDLVDKKQVKIKCCSTDRMQADHMLKPPQGQTFVNMRKRIMGLQPLTMVKEDERRTNQAIG